MYVDISLKSSNCFVLLNEYCAHSVEGHFTPQGYKNYGSFFKVLDEFNLKNDNDRHKVIKSMLLGNTFCQDILTIIEPFMDNYNLINEIKQEFKKGFNDSHNCDESSFLIEDTLDIFYLLDFINFVLLTGLENIEL